MMWKRKSLQAGVPIVLLSLLLLGAMLLHRPWQRGPGAPGVTRLGRPGDAPDALDASHDAKTSRADLNAVVSAFQGDTPSSDSRPGGSGPSIARQGQSATPPEGQGAVPEHTLHDLLEQGRGLAAAGDIDSLQRVFGAALLRRIRGGEDGIIPDLLGVVGDEAELPLLRKTVLEALMWSCDALPITAREGLFGLASRTMRTERDPDLRATAISAAARMLSALRQEALLPDAEAADFTRLVLEYVADRDLAEQVRRAAIVELSSLKVTDLAPRLQAIMAEGGRERISVALCASVALADMGEAAAVPQMISLLESAQDQDVFISLAYSIAQLNTDVGLAALVDNASRFEGASQPFIAKQDERVTEILTRGDSESLSTAIRAIPYMPEAEQRRHLMGLAVAAVNAVPGMRSPNVIRALLAVVAETGTPADCKAVIDRIGEDQRWQEEWRRVMDRSQAQSGRIVGYKKLEDVR